MPQSVTALLAPLVLGCGLVALGLPEAQAQSRRGQQAPAQRQVAPSQNPAGTDVPSYARPSDPSSSFGQPPSGSNAPGGNAQASSGPGMPDGDGGPNQVPLGGAEWLAAAGAAYALNRLRKEGNGEDEESDDEMP
ncbi:MAG: hypothetical protein BRD30_05210 [Bacteroidetes bacterium QH_2_63_10]|nr:MAG: hypothetical protein BRD30_05210 [Bacteroidetes bacterium QH_2_63_10]